MKILKLSQICGLTLGCLLTSSLGFAEVPRDNFYWLGQINKATILINSEEGLLTANEAKSFAKGLNTVLTNGNQKGGDRPNNVIKFEPYLIKAAGPEVTKVHAGRSSQDMLSTCTYAELKEDLLALATAENKISNTLVTMAEKYKATAVPSYTNGVAAQPTSYGHYLLAFADGFNRDFERLQQYYTRLDRCPMGSTVLNGTSWPLNREKMAHRLGFATIGYNTYDSNQIYTIENGAEVSYIATTLSLHVGDFIEDVMQQYAQPRPWILLEEGGKNTYVSSAMPQKRNPGLLNSTRTEASSLIGEGFGAILRTHNVPPGMADGRRGLNSVIKNATKEANNFNDILLALRVNPERALEELNLDWTSTQELADVLMKEHNVPFRIGHHYASELVTYARSNGLTPLTLPYEKAKEIYVTVMAKEGRTDAFPFSQEKYKEILNPEDIIKHRAVKGGPQPSEMAIMLKQGVEKVSAQKSWITKKQNTITEAENKLNTDFNNLLNK